MEQNEPSVLQIIRQAYGFVARCGTGIEYGAAWRRRQSQTRQGTRLGERQGMLPLLE